MAVKSTYISKLFIRIVLLAPSLGCFPSLGAAEGQLRRTAATDTSWQLGPFERVEEKNPILLPLANSQFFCPLAEKIVHWEAKDVFNPAAVVRNNKVYLIYRAEDHVGPKFGTKRFGLAFSDDGVNFQRLSQPVFYPDHDAAEHWEQGGGVEDPRIVEDEMGRYVMTYTAYDGLVARLMVATSFDLHSWHKHGPAFRYTLEGKYLDLWSKSGSIVSRRSGEHFVAEKINGSYWMYWGDSNIYLARSSDLLNWEIIEQDHKPRAVLEPRAGLFDSELVEPGPQAMLSDAGILLLYNGKNAAQGGDVQLQAGTYTAAQVLFSSSNPSQLLQRSATYFLKPETSYEKEGQVPQVCFIEGLVNFKGVWRLYYGAADSTVATAIFRE